jgi:hypothetical protein
MAAVQAIDHFFTFTVNYIESTNQNRPVYPYKLVYGFEDFAE